MIKPISFEKIFNVTCNLLSTASLDLIYLDKHPYFSNGKLLWSKLLETVFSKIKDNEEKAENLEFLRENLYKIDFYNNRKNHYYYYYSNEKIDIGLVDILFHIINQDDSFYYGFDNNWDFIYKYNDYKISAKEILEVIKNDILNESSRLKNTMCNDKENITSFTEKLKNNINCLKEKLEEDINSRKEKIKNNKTKIKDLNNDLESFAEEILRNVKENNKEILTLKSTEGLKEKKTSIDQIYELGRINELEISNRNLSAQVEDKKKSVLRLIESKKRALSYEENELKRIETNSLLKKIENSEDLMEKYESFSEKFEVYKSLLPICYGDKRLEDYKVLSDEFREYESLSFELKKLTEKSESLHKD